MKAIIPAKGKSTRLENKNWRPFYQGKSLVEIKIEQLLQVLSPSDIFLSCDELEKKSLVEKYEINFLHRGARYANDETPWSEVIGALVDDIPCSDDEDIAWVEAVTPLFNDFSKALETWKERSEQFDSLVAARRVRDFLIDEFGRAVNFNYGHWHCWSQDLRPLYSFEALCIMKKRDIRYFNYVIGKKPYIFEIDGVSIDIDDKFEFEMAQNYYERLHGRKMS